MSPKSFPRISFVNSLINVRIKQDYITHPASNLFDSETRSVHTPTLAEWLNLNVMASDHESGKLPLNFLN